MCARPGRDQPGRADVLCGSHAAFAARRSSRRRIGYRSRHDTSRPPEVSAAICRPREVVRLDRHDVVRAVPAIHPMSGYWLALAAPYRSGSIHEIPYYASQLGSGAGGLGGLIYAGLLTAGGFEDRLYARSATVAGPVHGRPAVATVTMGGNDVIAWEVAPGTMAYLGYSGA
jgi:hypothetical protein